MPGSQRIKLTNSLRLHLCLDEEDTIGNGEALHNRQLSLLHHLGLLPKDRKGLKDTKLKATLSGFFSPCSKREHRSLLSTISISLIGGRI